ncbi:MAG: VOC family protein [Synechococcales cyanobacterium T60_A2020_003]|nr:VOC family protein [Synechococcales cyanobacterium T60_A2020_003]
MELQRPLHTAILVTNLERAEQFYGEVLGLEKVERSLKYPGAWYQLGDYQIHLMVDASIPSSLHNVEKWGRNRHIAFGVTNFEAAKAHLLAHHCPIQESTSGRAALFTQDPDGNVVELSQL